MQMKYARIIVCIILGSLAMGVLPMQGWADIIPSYSATFQDAITGDNEFLFGGEAYWDVDAGADIYQEDIYERPTIQTYETVNSRFAAKEYWENLDIVTGRAGFDDDYLYISIEMYGLRNRSSTDSSLEGLKYQYGFRLGTNGSDPASAGGLLLIVDDPANKDAPTSFNGNKASGFLDTNSDVGGKGISWTKQDDEDFGGAGSPEVNGDGYDLEVIADGTDSRSGSPTKNEVVLFSRINPDNAAIVEFAFDYKAFGLTDSDLLGLPYLVFEANKGLQDNQNYLWNDEYNKDEAGSPNPGGGPDLNEFGFQEGLGDIYELDTLQGGLVPVPEPASLGLLVFGGLALLIRGKR